MRRAMFALFAALLLALAPAGAALGHSSSGAHEEETDEEGNTTWNNDVECAEEGQTANTPAGSAFVGHPDPEDGVPEDVDLGAEICNDGDEEIVIIQGRAGAALGVDGDDVTGVSVFADGDRDNPEGSAQGWARVDLNDRDGLVVRCGDDEGNQDATHPNPKLPDEPENNEPGDGQDGFEDCG